MKPPSKHFEFNQKWAIFGRLEKKSFQKWLEPNTFSVCYPNTLLYIVFDHTFAENATILVMAVFWGSGGQIEIPRKVL